MNIIPSRTWVAQRSTRSRINSNHSAGERKPATTIDRGDQMIDVLASKT